MGDKQPKAKPISNSYLPKAGPKSKNGGKHRRSSGISGRTGQSGYLIELEKEKREQARTAFIEKLTAIAAEARLIADNLLGSSNGRASEIVEEVICEYYTRSQKSEVNQLARVEDVKRDVVASHKANQVGTDLERQRNMRFITFAAFTAVDALKGAFDVVVNNESREDAVAAIEQRNEVRRQTSNSKRELTTA